MQQRCVRWFPHAVVLVLVLVGCGGVPEAGQKESVTGPISLLFVGDLMLGREVAPIAAADPAGLFEEVRHVVGSADLALANLESPLTTRPHVHPNPIALEAHPDLASLLAAAGFDVISVANNHSGDAGPLGVLGTLAAVEGAGIDVVGGGSDLAEAIRPTSSEIGDVRIAFLAFDATGAGLAAGVATAGVAAWDPDLVQRTVKTAARESDLLVVSVHGGVEYLPEPDPRMEAIASDLARWGADVVWGHGAHVVHPTSVVRDEAGPGTLVATSLGNFLFDQRGPLTGRGAVLEVLANDDGLIGYRLGKTSHHDLRVHFEAWDLPEGDAALIEDEWWSLLREPEVRAEPVTTIDDFEWGVVVAASTGRVTDRAQEEIVVSFRHVPGPHPVRDGLADVDWVDAEGMSPHIGIYDARDLAPIWVAGMIPAPVADLAACDGSIAFAYSTLDNPGVVATGAAVWRPFGLDAAERLDGTGTPACADIDGDGSTEPVILNRR